MSANPIPKSVTAKSFEGAEITFSLTEDVDIAAVFTYEFPGNTGHIRAPIDIDSELVERLFWLTRHSVLQQIADARSSAAEEAALRRTPKVKEIRDADVPQFVLEPLILEHTGRKKVIDVRGGDRRRQLSAEAEPIVRDFADFGYLPGVVVHRTECVKVRSHVEAESQVAAWKKVAGGQKETIHGRFSRWEEITPQIRKGALHVELCLTCKPLGRYTKAVNARTSFGVAAKPPPEMPWEFPAYMDRLGEWQRTNVWQAMMEMTPPRWEALADLIEWAAKEDAPDA